MGMPDVFSDEFPKIVDKAAAGSARLARATRICWDISIANEPPWPGRESLVVDVILERPRARSARSEGLSGRRRYAGTAQAVHLPRIRQVSERDQRSHPAARPEHLNLGFASAAALLGGDAARRRRRSMFTA